MKIKNIKNTIKKQNITIPSFIKVYNFGFVELWYGQDRDTAISYYMEKATYSPQKECKRYLKIVDDLKSGLFECGKDK